MDDDKESVRHPADTDTAGFLVIPPVVGPSEYRPLEDAFGVLEGNSVLADIDLVLGGVPFKDHSSEYNYKL